MDNRLKNLIQADRTDRLRHDEILESVGAMHGDRAATAVYILHRQYRLIAADMMQIAGRLPDEIRARYLDAHQETYSSLAGFLIDSIVPEGPKQERVVEELVGILARMNNDTATILLKAAKDA